jgi:hypothetical protein
MNVPFVEKPFLKDEDRCTLKTMAPFTGSAPPDVENR